MIIRKMVFTVGEGLCARPKTSTWMVTVRHSGGHIGPPLQWLTSNRRQSCKSIKIFLRKHLWIRNKGVPLQSQSSGCSSARFRVRVWGACGRWFESSHPDSRKALTVSGLIRRGQCLFLCPDFQRYALGTRICADFFPARLGATLPLSCQSTPSKY